MTPLQEDMTMIHHYKLGVEALVERLCLHDNIEICLIPYATTANMTEQTALLYGDDYKFLGVNQKNALIEYIKSIDAVGSFNMGDCLRRTFYLINNSPDPSYPNCFINLIPSPPTAAALKPFEEGMPLEPEYMTAPYEAAGDFTGPFTFRFPTMCFSKVDGTMDWALRHQFNTTYPGAFEQALRDFNMGGTGALLAPGVVDENSLSYVRFFAQKLHTLKLDDFHIYSSVVSPLVLKGALCEDMAMDESAEGKIWFSVTSSDQFHQAINVVANTIVQELKVRDADYQQLFDGQSL